MEQLNNIGQQVQVQEKIETMQKVVLGVGMLCAFFTLVNFGIVFGIGAKNLADKLTEQDLNWNLASTRSAVADTRVAQVQVSLNRELNNLATYYTAQENVNLLAINLTNNSTSTLTLTQINFNAYVYGGTGTSSATSTPYFTPGYNNLDNGVNADNLITNVRLFKYINGQYVQVSTSTLIWGNGNVVLQNMNIELTPSVASSSMTLVLRGDVTHYSPFGNYPDKIAFNIPNCQNNIYVYNQNQRVRVAPDNSINNTNYPIVYHEIEIPPGAPVVPSFFNSGAWSTTSIHMIWDNVPNELGYRIWRSTQPNYFLIVVAEPGLNSTSYLDANLSPNTHYYYRLAAYNASGTSPFIYTDSWTLGN